MTGIETYRTKSGFKVAKIHYTSDPDKNPATPEGREWLKRALAGVKGGISSSSWRKEMEIDFKARSGQKVFEGLELMREKIMIDPFEIPSWQETRGGYDWGKRNPFAYVEGTVDHDSNKILVYGAYGSVVEIPSQAQMIKRSPYAGKTKLRLADPSIWTEDQVAKDGSYTSFQKIFSELGIIFEKGRTDDIACMERLEQEWFDIKVDTNGQVIKIPKETPTLKIFKTLEFLWESLVNLRWSEFTPTTEQEHGKKEEISHQGNDPWDALKYWLLSLPMPAIVPKPTSKDRAMPLACELLEENNSKLGRRNWIPA